MTGRWIAALLLLALALFCGVGCLATLEPLDARTRWGWRLGYGVVGLAAALAAASALRPPRGPRGADRD